MSCSTSRVLPDAVGRRGRRLGHLTGHLGQQRPPAGLQVDRQEAGPVDPRHHRLGGSDRTGGRHDVGHPGQCVGGREGANAATVQLGAGIGVGHARRPRTEVDAERRECPARAAARSTRRGRRWPRCRRSGRSCPTPRRSRRWTGRSPAADRRSLHSNTMRPRPSRRTPDPTSALSSELSGVVLFSPAAWTMPASGGSSACTVAIRRATSCGSATSAAITRTSQPCCSLQRVDAALRGLAGCAPAGQHQLPGAVRGQVSGDLQSERAQPAGHQIRCVGAQFQLLRVRLSGPPDQSGNMDLAARAARSGLRPATRSTIWSISRDHSSALAPDRSASPPHTCGYSSAAARQNPHRLVCSGDTVSVSVTRCAPRVTTQIGRA